MTTPMHRIVNVETNEVTDIPFTDAELKAYAAAEAAEKAEIDAKAQAKAALLERLGITADEAALLLG